MNIEKIAFDIEFDLIDKLREAKTKNGININFQINKAIREYLEKESEASK